MKRTSPFAAPSQLVTRHHLGRGWRSEMALALRAICGWLVVLGVAGVASASQLNWSGTLLIDLADFPSEPVIVGGVATINNSSGTIPAHLNTMRLKASRHVNVTPTLFMPITDPEGDPAIAAISFVGITLGSGSLGPVSGAIASTTVLSRNVLPVMGVLKFCGSVACGPDSLPLLLTM